MTQQIGHLGIGITADPSDLVGGMDKAAIATERAAARMAASQDKFIAKLEKAADRVGKEKAELLALEAAQRGVTDRAQPFIDKIAQAGAGLEKGAHMSSGMTRELIVLGHEAATGNFSRFGGSLLVLAEYSTTATKALSILVGPVGALVAAVGLFALAVYQGAQESKAFANSLVLTGNYAGITEGQFNALAKSVAAASGSTIGSAREIAQGLVSTGNIGSRALAPLAAVAVQYARLSDQTAEEVVSDFAKMGDGVAKWALEHNKSLNFLSGPQYDYIKRLEEQGKTEEAELVVAKALSDHFGQVIPKNLGYLQQALASAGHFWDDFWDKAKGVGRAQTLDDKLAQITSQLSAKPKTQQNSSWLGDPLPQDYENYLRQQRAALESAKRFAEAGAATQAQSDKDAKAHQAASDYLDALNKQIKGVDLLKEALAKLHREQDAFRKDGGIITPEQAAAQEAQVIKDNSPPAGPKDHSQDRLETAFTNRMNALGEEGIKLDAERESWERYGKAVSNSRAAVVEFDIEQGKLAGKNGAALTNEQMYEVWARAYDDDLKQEAVDQAKLNAELDKRITKLQATSDAQAMNARQSQIASELAEAETKGLVKGSAAYTDYAARVAIAVNAQADQALQRKLASEQLSTDDEVRALEAQARALGMSTLERQKAAAALKLYDTAQKDIAANPDQETAILAAATSKYNALAAAMDRNLAATQSFELGSSAAFTKYQENAANAASYAEQMIGGGLKKTEDAIVAFAETGKLKFGDVFKFMADEYLRQQARILVSQGAGGLSSLLGGIGAGYFARNTGAATTVANALPGDSMDNLMKVTGAFGTSGAASAAGGAAAQTTATASLTAQITAESAATTAMTSALTEQTVTLTAFGTASSDAGALVLTLGTAAEAATQGLYRVAAAAAAGGGGGGLGGFFGLFSGSGGSGAGAGASTVGADVIDMSAMAAKGRVFDGAGMQAFGRGDVFHSPTLFRFAQGGGFATGVMGEAGPEAVMPLHRGANGKLGVVLNGGSQQPQINVQVLNNHAGAQVTTRPKSGGGLQVIVDQIEQRMGDNIDNGVGLARNVGGRFGLNSAAGLAR